MSGERAILHVLNLQEPLMVRFSVMHIDVQSFVKNALTSREVETILDRLEVKRQVVLIRSEEKELKAKITDAGKARLAEGE